MDLEILKQLVKNKLQMLENQKRNMFENGDIAGISIMDNEIMETKITLEKLETL